MSKKFIVDCTVMVPLQIEAESSLEALDKAEELPFEEIFRRLHLHNQETQLGFSPEAVREVQ